MESERVCPLGSISFERLGLMVVIVSLWVIRGAWDIYCGNLVMIATWARRGANRERAKDYEGCCYVSDSPSRS